MVGHTDEQGVQLPPLHPRCRCTIHYREVKPSTAPSIGGANKPFAPEQVNAIRDAEDKAFHSKTGADFGFGRMKTPPDWSREISYANGDVLHCNGDVHGIPIHWFKQIAAQLEGATVTHNHPLSSANEYSFSDDDFKLFKNFGLARLRGIDEKFIYELNRNPSENELAEYTLVEIYGLGLGFEDYHATIMLKALVEGFGYWRRGR